ncbi:MAG TPA: hypothetical protein V6C76_02895 [Drouetiella sp.]
MIDINRLKGIDEQPSSYSNTRSAQAVEDPPIDNWADELNHKPELPKPWDSFKGRAIISVGVGLPVMFYLMLAISCSQRISMLLIKHPAETLIEIALALMIPVFNYQVWNAICKKDLRYAMLRGLQNGLAIGGCLNFLVTALAVIFAGKVQFAFNSEMFAIKEVFAAIAGIYALVLAVSIYLGYELRGLREFNSARVRTVIYSACGVVLAVLGFIGAEAKSMYMRVAEHKAFAGSTDKEKVEGLQMLRALNAEQDMRLECADSRTVGLPGLFIPISTATEQQLYFAAFGKPFRDDRSADLSGFSNEYLRRHVVGAMIPELSLVRSGMDGTVNADTLSSTVNWTYVFKNNEYEDVEARAELALPPGAVISNVTVWQDGQPVSAAFAASGKAVLEGRWTSVGHETPAVVSDLGRNRTLLHCYPVKAQEELKVSLSMVMPLKLDKLSEATLALPKFIDTNFEVNGEHQIRLRSSQQLSLGLKGLKETVSATGQRILSGSLKNEELSGLGLSVTAMRKPILGPIAVADPLLPTRTIFETIQQSPVKLPNHLIVVLDGSTSVKNDLDAIKSGLKSLPANVTSSLIVASDLSGKKNELQPLRSALDSLSAADFEGGQDNLQAVVKAANTAGETKNGAVLWIHGPQPTLNPEYYLTAPFTETPSFYEFALDNSVTDGNEFFKHHREIGPFNAVPRNGKIDHDLTRFVSKWQPGGMEYKVKLTESYAPLSGEQASAAQGRELKALLAKEQSQSLISSGDLRAASEIAVRNKLVTPVSAAVVMQSTPPSMTADAFSTQSNAPQAQVLQGASSGTIAPQSPPELQGATNGTIGSNGADAEFVTGVNTAGTVRVNNLANLEALLNIFSNASEVILVLYGIGILLTLLMNKQNAGRWFGLAHMSTPAIIALGAVAILIGLSIPGVVNWFVASGRDANLFS